MRLTELYPKGYKYVICLIVTIALWGYFTIGFVLFFAPFFIFARVFAQDSETAFQRLSSIFYKGFFILLKILIPDFKLNITSSIYQIKSAVVIANHLSFLDPLLLISVFPHHKTIVKSQFFKFPIFGALIKASGYMPSTTSPRLIDLMTQQVNKLGRFFNRGGNFFIFPEGTRAANNSPKPFHPSAFKIARRYGVAVEVLHIRNTHKIYKPGKFLFNVFADDKTIEIHHLGTVLTKQDDKPVSTDSIIASVNHLLGEIS